jgi:very-short-patch-repair endonuclease
MILDEKIICKLCNKNFKSYKSLSNHLRYCKKNIYKFNSESYYDYFLKDENEGKCFLCNEKTTFKNINLGYHKYCNKCSKINPERIDKWKKTCENKYNGHPMNNDEIKEKFKNTMIEKYGVPNALKNKKFLKQAINKRDFEKEHQTFLNTFEKKYKKTNPMCIKEISEKMSNTKKEKFFKLLLNSDRLKNKVKPNFDINAYQNSIQQYEWICCKCNKIFISDVSNGRIPRCSYCYPTNRIQSYLEKEISNFCKKYYPDLIENSRSIIPPLELDIYIPEKKLAIEFDGLYWHSEINGNKESGYHYNKTQLCEEKGIQLIHIFEDEWLNKQDILESIIKSKLGIYDQKIYARKTEFKFVSQKDANQFLFDNHLQGEINGQHYGLYHNNKLVSLITISKPRFNKKFDYELLRFCNKKNIQIIGGLSKLIKNFKKLNSGSIISYCDRRYSDGSGYLNSGFEQINKTIPRYYYIKNSRKYNRINFQKHKLEEQLEIYDSNLTEWQNMQLNDYDRIWDCGNLVFQY